MKFFNKILIANRGEIALRIMRSAKKLGIKTVAIYTESECNAEYVKLADESVTLGNGNLESTFLNISKIIEITKSTGAQAIHPGYGFLSENSDFAKECEENNLVFIGPSSEILKLMSSKPQAKLLAQSLGIPVAYSIKIESNTPIPQDELLKYPILIKASFGGGGKGMELVNDYIELKEKIEKSSRIALNYFGNGEVFIEQFISNARHVEVQLIGDNHNNIIHLYERECSIQRNHQKIIEEGPAVFLSEALRNELLNAAVKIGNALNYSSAGTVEFLVDELGAFYFMEMNPRIQVEHAVTEQITGVDIIGEQLRVASGLPLSFSQKDIKTCGHAIELRVYAENPAQNFTPSTHPLISINLPNSSNLRIESDINIKHTTANQFDPLLVKFIGSGKDRESVIRQLQEQLQDLNIMGPETNVKYLEAILAHPNYRSNKITVEFCKNYHSDLIRKYNRELTNNQLIQLIAAIIANVYIKSEEQSINDPWKYLGYWRSHSNNIRLFIGHESYQVLYDSRDKLYPSFELEGKKINFIIDKRGENFIDVRFENKISRIFVNFRYSKKYTASFENTEYTISLPGLLENYADVIIGTENDSKFESDIIKSPLHGKILEINVIESQLIKKGDLILVIESMKSENRILAPKDAKVKRIAVNVGAQVTDRMPLIFLEE